MWTSDRSRTAPGGGRIYQIPRLLGLIAFVALLNGCGDGGAPADEAGTGSSEIAEPAVSAAPAAESAPPPATVADLFPAGEGRDLVLNNCSSCHSAACTVMGQRPAARWAALEASHQQHVANLGEEELTAVFDYLEANFSDSQPEPNVPPEFIQGGCTPF